MMKPKISAIILTYNEEKHLARAIDSIKGFVTQVIVIDSFSTDKTVEIAESRGAEVLQNKWENNHARQLNWGLDNAPIAGEWIMRLDADEYLTPELAVEIESNIMDIPDTVDGIYMRRRIHFMGKWMKHGGTYPMWMLRLWRTGKGRCENRWMDEHIVLSEGETVRFENDFVDDNLNDLTWWTNKHNHYATREAADLLNHKYHFMAMDKRVKENKEQAMLKRWVKENVYSIIPLFVRPFFYFIFRYVFKLGFLDGCEGLQWNVLQGFWYRFLVDAKIYEAERKIVNEADKTTAIRKLVVDKWGLAPPSSQ